MIAPGGTPSVNPVSVATYTGLWPAMTLSEVDPGKVVATIVHGFVLGDGGWAHPTMGEPTRSGSQRTGACPACTAICFGINVTRPPWAQRIVALLVTTGGTDRVSLARAVAARRGHGSTGTGDLLTPLGKSGIFDDVERSLVPPMKRDLHVPAPA